MRSSSRCVLNNGLLNFFIRRIRREAPSLFYFIFKASDCWWIQSFYQRIFERLNVFNIIFELWVNKNGRLKKPNLFYPFSLLTFNGALQLLSEMLRCNFSTLAFLLSVPRFSSSSLVFNVINLFLREKPWKRNSHPLKNCPQHFRKAQVNL